MAFISYPENIPGPQVSGFSRQEVVGFTESQPAAGPSFVVPYSDDTPQFHNINYLFKQGQARVFQGWLRENKIKLESPFFDGPLITEDGSVETQECRFTADGYPQFQGKTVGGLFSYTARVLTRVIINNDDDNLETLNTLNGLNTGDVDLGANQLDIGMCG